MKILLLNPPTETDRKFIREGRCTQEQGVWGTLWPPVSLAVIGAVLERDGHAVSIHDCPAEDMLRPALADIVRADVPGLVIWSTGTPTIQSDLQLAREIKAVCRDIITAVFGTHVTVLDQQCLGAFPDLDCIIRNEPEETARELAGAAQSGKNLQAVQGLTWRSSAGDIVSNPGRAFIDDLDSLPPPAWHLLDTSRYCLPLKGRPFLIVAPQRGCPFRCSFCTCRTYYGGRLRKRSVDSVLDEIERDMREFGVRDFFIWSETFVVDKDYVAALCRAVLDRKLSISWTCNSRIDIVDAELLVLMARAGCWMISFGIESAEQAILDGVEKGTKVAQAPQAVRLAKQAGMKVAGHFILGLPGETEATMRKTLGLAGSLGLDVTQFYSAVPFPGSRLYDQAVQEGWVAPQDYSCFKQDRAVMELPSVSAVTVDAFRRRGARQFFFNPLNWLRTARMLEWRGLAHLGATVLGFFSWRR